LNITSLKKDGEEFMNFFGAGDLVGIKAEESIFLADPDIRIHLEERDQ